MTHTYATLWLSPPAYREIEKKLKDAGYVDCFHKEQEGIVIDLHGIAVVLDPDETDNSDCDGFCKLTPKIEKRELLTSTTEIGGGFVGAEITRKE